MFQGKYGSTGTVVGMVKYTVIQYNNYLSSSRIGAPKWSSYARCNALERLELWDSLEYMA